LIISLFDALVKATSYGQKRLFEAENRLKKRKMGENGHKNEKKGCFLHFIVKKQKKLGEIV
jgi:hypothetical protein